jgi:hypothetical protein
VNSDDRDLMFGDWDEPAEYRRVVETLDVSTGELVSTTTATALRVIGDVATRERPPQSGDALAVYDHAVGVRREDLPEWPLSTSARMCLRGTEWLVVGGDVAGDGLCVVVRLKRV